MNLYFIRLYHAALLKTFSFQLFNEELKKRSDQKAQSHKIDDSEFFSIKKEDAKNIKPCRF